MYHNFIHYLVILGTLCNLTVAQVGSEFKNTWAQSDPVACAAWFEKYLPVIQSPDNCDNNKCECAIQGRVQLEEKEGLKTIDGFGLHTVNCIDHPFGYVTLGGNEEKIREQWTNFEHLNPFMEYNVGLWTNHLSKYYEAFKKDKIPFVGLKWKSDDKDEYYSILVNPCGSLVIEFIGDPIKAVRFPWIEHDKMRFSFAFTPVHPLRETKTLLTALKISRATSRMEEVKNFYSTDLDFAPVVTETYLDKSELAIFMFRATSVPRVQLHFWQHKESTSEDFGIKEYEDFLRKTHNDTIKSDICGFDKYLDNHFGLNTTDQAYIIDTFAD